jgi:hypothetical protein
MAAPPLGCRCAKWGREHGPGNRCTLGQMEDPNGFGPCHYAFCSTKGTHPLKVCMVLNNRCTGCLYRGHQRDGRCGQVEVNLEIFENSANYGYVTCNRYQDWGASNGLYPIFRLAQLKHIAINGGYNRRLSLNERNGRELIGDSDNQHNRWVGAEPWATQVIVENTFTQARVHEAHSAVQIECGDGGDVSMRTKNKDTTKERNVGRDGKASKDVQHSTSHLSCVGALSDQV